MTPKLTYKRRTLIIICFLIINAVSAISASVKVGDLYYNLNPKAKTAEVTYKSCKKKIHYNQDWDIVSVIIPSEITYKGHSYKVTRIGANAFSNCKKLMSIGIPNSVKSLGYKSFYRCEELKEIVLPNSLEQIGAYAFIYCKNLTSINLPETLQSIDVCAFLGCKSIKKINIPSSVYIIGLDAFKNCDSLNFVTLNSNAIVQREYDYTFTLNNIFGEQVTTYILGPTIYSIGSYAFAHATELFQIELSTSITDIGRFAFSGCRKLHSIQVPANVSRINDYTFYSCANLVSVNIPEGVQYIGFNAFRGCNKLREVFIPNSVKYIGAWAFGWCTDLTSVCIGNSVSGVGASSFKGCNNIKEFIYPKGLNINAADLAPNIKLKAYDRSNPPRPREINPPLLSIVEESLIFHDASTDNSIDADESCNIKFIVRNDGKGSAYDCSTKVHISGTTKGINVQTVELPTISTGQTYEVTIPVTSNIDTQDGTVTFTIEVYEPNGWGIAPFDLTVATKAYDPPLLQVVDYNVASNSGKIRKMEPFTLSFNLQNTKYGNAEDVKVRVKLPANVFVMDGSAEFSYPLIKSGEVKSVKITLAANNNYPTANIPISIEVKEKHGKFAENKQLDIALNQTTHRTINIAAKDEPQIARKEIQLAMMTSAVDRNIPISKEKNPNTFVLVIANEHYQQVASVPYALNDGNIFREYCIKTLGIGEKHIKYLSDATGNQIKAGVNWLANLTGAFDEPQIIVYYAGHGIPDEGTKSAYLLPVDGDGRYVQSAYKLDDMYQKLGAMNTKSVTVFMDACFSGSKRENGMLASARGVAIKAKSGVPQGNMVVFSAAQGDETAYPNNDEQHGIFTYYLLKKLQETKGDVTLLDLGDYITTNVRQQSIVKNGKPQTPCVIPSASLGTEWQSWKLKL